MECEKDFSQKIKKLINNSGRILEAFKATRSADRHETSIYSKEFTEVSVFSAKLYVFLFKNLSLCNIELFSDDDMYPEFKEDFGKDIIKIFIASGKEFLANIIEKVPKADPVFWKSFEPFKRFAGKSKDQYDQGLENPEGAISSLQRMTVYILVMCLYGGQVNLSCFAYAPACWVDLFYDIYYVKFLEHGGWNLWGKFREEIAASIPVNLKEMNWLDTVQAGLLLCKEILSSSTLAKILEMFDSLIETERSRGRQNSEYEETLKVTRLTLLNSAANRANLGKSASSFPFPSHRLWNQYGSEYINLLIFSRHLMNRLFKMVGLPVDRMSEDETDKTLLDAVESVAKATILMLLYKTPDKELLLESFKSKCSCFGDQQSIDDHLWLFVADAYNTIFIKTTAVCLNVLQMIGFVFVIAATFSNKHLYNCADKIWVKVFVLKYSRQYYSQSGGWMTFIRDAFPTVQDYAFDYDKCDYMDRIKENKWSEIIAKVCEVLSPGIQNYELCQLPEASNSESQSSTTEERSDMEENAEVLTELNSSPVRLEDKGDSTFDSISYKESLNQNTVPQVASNELSEQLHSESNQVRTPSIELIDIADSSNDASRSSSSTSEKRTEFQGNSEIIEMDQSPSLEERVDSRTPELNPRQDSPSQKTIKVVLNKLSEDIFAQYGQSLERSSSDFSLVSTSEASKECVGEVDRDLDGATIRKKFRIENKSEKSPKSFSEMNRVDQSVNSDDETSRKMSDIGKFILKKEDSTNSKSSWKAIRVEGESSREDKISPKSAERH